MTACCARLVAGGARSPRPRAAGRRARPARRAHRRPAHPRGRLRVRQVRPGRAGHQRHRHASPPALGRGGAVPGRPRSAGRRPGVTYADLEGAHRGAAGRVRARGRVADRVPPAAQGGPDRRPPVVLARRRSPARAAPRCRWHAAADRARRRGRGARRRWRSPAAESGAAAAAAAPAGLGDPGRRAAGRGARRARGRRAAGRCDRGAAGLDTAPGGRARRHRGRRPAQPAARRPSGHRPGRAGRRGAGLGCGALPAAAGRDTARSSPPRPTGELGALVIAGVDLADLPDPAAALEALDAGRVRGQPRAARQRGHRPRRRGASRSPPWPRRRARS